MQRGPTDGSSSKQPAKQRSALEEALLQLGGRVRFDERIGCYRLDGSPVRVQDLLRLGGRGTSRMDRH